jgi:Alpha/beta hydrolase domain
MVSKRLGLATFVLVILATLAAPILAQARITRIEITRIESPTFEGASFGAVGQYEKLVGRAYGELDPSNARNAIIVDLGLAPRNAAGMVEYSTDFYMLRPVDPANANHRVLYEVNNRGDKILVRYFNDVALANDPTTEAAAGNGFLMRQGYTLVWSGWDFTAPTGNNRLRITVPVAKNADGSSIVGPSLEEFAVDNSTTATGSLTYAAASLDKSLAGLTVRVHGSDPPTEIPASGWDYVDSTGRAIRLLPVGTLFQQSRIYAFTYPAKDPVVAGIGFAATRDVLSYVRQGGSPAGDVQAIYTWGLSQSARYLRDFVRLGFNQDEQGERTIDGVLNSGGGTAGGFFNHRFAQPGRAGGGEGPAHAGRWYPSIVFPFADPVTFDPVTGKTDGFLRRCLSTNTCPKIFEVNSELEYWSKPGSLLTTDTLGNDLPDPADVRFFLIASLPHVPADISAPAAPGSCQQPRNPLAPNPVLRALLVDMDEWVSAGIAPPASRVPRRADGTLVPGLPQAGVGFPNIPGVKYNGVPAFADRWDWGPTFDEGFLTILPPLFLGSPYPRYVPKTDADGNDIAGVRLPEVTVPVATYSGWNLRTPPFGGDDLCTTAGQMIAFAQTKTERLASGDPRLSIEERYRNHGKYVSAVAHAANGLHKDRLLLDEDVQRYVDAAAESAIGK